MTEDAVTVAYVHDGQNVTYSWHVSLLQMLWHDSAHHQRIVRGGFAQIKYATGGIVRARNMIVRDFLATKTAGWLAWIDTDHGFAPDTIDRLIQSADPVERPVVGALTFGQAVGPSDGWGGWRPAVWPVLTRWVEDSPNGRGFLPWLDYPRDQVVQVAGTGSGLILIHRSVFERIAEAEGPRWYSPLPTPSGNGEELSEDFSFCLRLRQLGIPLHVDTSVKTTHMKPTWLNEAEYLVGRAIEAETFDLDRGLATINEWRAARNLTPVEQTRDAESLSPERVAVIVPTRRPGNAARFMESLNASTDRAEAYAVVFDDELGEQTGVAWEAAGATVIVGQANTYPTKLNLGYRKTSEPWMLLVGDDVAFRPGWLDEALRVAEEQNASVVGVNGLGNAAELRGEFAAHQLVRRSYVDSRGASWDGPGVIAHTGYEHLFVDNEIVTAAKQRGVWAMAPAAVVEHLHHYWGKSEMDDTYRQVESCYPHDEALFRERLAAAS